MRVFDAPNAEPTLALFFWDCLSAAAGERAVQWAELIAAESHSFPPALGLELDWMECNYGLLRMGSGAQFG
jgi:hypothetical protein